MTLTVLCLAAPAAAGAAPGDLDPSFGGRDRLGHGIARYVTD